MLKARRKLTEVQMSNTFNLWLGFFFFTWQHS